MKRFALMLLTSLWMYGAHAALTLTVAFGNEGNPGLNDNEYYGEFLNGQGNVNRALCYYRTRTPLGSVTLQTLFVGGCPQRIAVFPPQFQSMNYMIRPLGTTNYGGAEVYQPQRRVQPVRTVSKPIASASPHRANPCEHKASGSLVGDGHGNYNTCP
ncbi:hypothetical protein [Acinetobacter brisouii]|uniref:hypothetical protein n=1 Tax=Acinetobacter brisouii TaxID=396323 RepID=UPI0005F7D7A7|nr:hypothetical protein [Acinetobacter brisouii]KJV39728.1 hypothetical protein VH98_04390 [Acinetobacter brisouii]